MQRKSVKKNFNRRKLILYILLAIGFLAVEFPGILLVGKRVYPFILGLPFLYGYVLCCWAYLCVLLFYAYKTSWGKKPFFKKNS